jgi:hypothetical protein
MSYSTETMREIWDDKTGEKVEVGPDRDALGMVEIRCKTGAGVITTRLAFPADEARLVAQAMLVCADELGRAEDQP